MTNKTNELCRGLSMMVGNATTILALCALMSAPAMLKAQSGGQGAIIGTVTDSTGAAIPDATITATNEATNVQTTRTTSGAGAYSVSPLPPGIYSVAVAAKGFKTLHQSNLSVDALNALGFNPVLSIGAETDTVEVTTAPPVLDTTNATVGLVMENQTYANLPLQMNNGQRDATAFASLVPGAQSGTRVPIIGGTLNFLGQLYLDGLPAVTVNQQGDNRLVSEAVDLDAVDQFQVVTSTPPAEYSGAGALNFTMKSGGQKYHGQVSDFVRNTAFDAWSFTAKAATEINAEGQVVPAPKPTEHQNELSVTFGGHVPHTADKLFFFFAYDKFHSHRGGVPQLFTVPTTLMRQGDLTELNGNIGTGYTGAAGDPSAGGTNKSLIYDPTSNSCVGSVCTRTPFQGMKNGIPTYNVIPSSYLSPISQKMQSFLPAPTLPNTLTNNYLGSNPTGFDNHNFDWRVDFDLSAKQRISSIGAMGAIHYLNNYAAGGTGSNTYGYLPLPYVGGTIANIFPKVYQVEDTYTITEHLINQLEYGVTRFVQPQTAATDGHANFSATAMGITNLPAGQASTVFPGVGFGTTGTVSTTLTGWAGPNNGSDGTQTVSPTTYALLDNLQWLKGKHSITIGFAFMWEEINTANPSGYSSVTQLQFNSNSTAQYSAHSNALSSSSGNSYASFLLGSVGNNGGAAPSINLQPVSEVGGRFHVGAPYIQDNWKINNKLTIDMGIRWDYFPPFHEVKDRWTFLNPNLTNAATNTPGMMQFAGNYGGSGVSCGCRTPVETYWKNFGPRVGLAYAADEKTVFRVGAAVTFSQSGGVGGRSGVAGGTGQLGFNVTANGTPELTTGADAGPSFYLNNGATLTSLGLANTDMFGKGFAYPAVPTPNVASQLLNTGNYLNPTTGKLVTAGSVSFADPYISSRAPEFIFFNAGLQRSITRDMTISVNYVGDEAHFLTTGSNVRGYWANQLNPVYLAALGPLTDSTGTKPILIAAATSANVTKAQTAISGLNIPAFFQAAANVNPTSSTLTIAQGLIAFPQYSGVSDLWGLNSGNISYHSLQITLLQREAHGLNFNLNYTYSKNIGDDGTFRSGFAVPSAAVSGGGKSWAQGRMDRSWTTISAPQSVHAFGVYKLPFGKGHIGNGNMLARTLASGWQIAGIYTYGSGTPVAVTSNICTSTTFPLQGQCMPDVSLGATSARINGSYGAGPNGTTAANLGNIRYIDSTKFATPANISTVSSSPIYLIGNAPRTLPLNLRSPGSQNLDTSLHRSFNLPKDMTFVFEVDCLNTWNKVQFSAPASNFGASNFGQISSIANTPRDFQFAGHINF
jgi:hypothetical protein